MLTFLQSHLGLYCDPIFQMRLLRFLKHSLDCTGSVRGRCGTRMEECHTASSASGVQGVNSHWLLQFPCVAEARQPPPKLLLALEVPRDSGLGLLCRPCSLQNNWWRPGDETCFLLSVPEAIILGSFSSLRSFFFF